MKLLSPLTGSPKLVAPDLGDATFSSLKLAGGLSQVTIDLVMTSNTAPSPYVASASTEYAGNGAYKAFRGSTLDGWISSGAAGAQWLRIDFGTAKTVGGYSIMGSRTGLETRSPKSWAFEGSNDATNWTVLDTRSAQSAWTAQENRNYAFTNATAYRYCRLNISENQGNSYHEITQFIVTAEGATVFMAATAAGRIGIGTETPAYQLQLTTDSAAKPGTGGLWTIVSDERIKKDIVPADLERCYEIVQQTPLKHFKFADGVYRDDQVQDKSSLGWIAQDVQKVFKHAVSIKPYTLTTGEVIEDCLDLNAGQMHAALYGAVQALILKVEALEARLGG